MPETQDPPSTAGMSMADAIAASPEAAAFFNNPPANINVPPAIPPPAPPPAPKPNAAPAAPPAPSNPTAPVKAPVKPTVAPSANPPSADDPPLSITSAQGKEDWKHLRTETHSLREQLKSKDAELVKMMETRSKVSPEVDTLKTQLHEMSERLRVTDVERHPQFQTYFNNKTASAIATARAAAGVEKAEEVARILQMPESDFRTEKIESILAELPVSRQSRMLSAMSQLDQVHAERTEALERATRDGATADTMAQQKREQDQQARATKMNQIFTAKLQEAQETNPAFQRRDGDNDWNAGVDEAIDYAKRIVAGQISIEDGIEATLYAASGKRLIQTAAALSEEVAALKAENASLRSATPSPGGGGGVDPTPEEPKSFAEAVAKAAESSGVFANRGAWGR